MIKYKIYEMSEKTKGVFKLRQYDDYMFDVIFDSIEEAFEVIKNHGNDYTHYTVLPYIYMT